MKGPAPGTGPAATESASTPLQLAQIEEPIGKVETVKGTVIATHADGSETPLQKGDPIFQGDELVTGPEGAIGIVFVDDSTFSLAEDARLTLDELVYDPGAQEGVLKASLAQGVFSFISGEIAKTDPEAMTVSTPMATIGIRGTTGAINLPAGETLTVVLASDAGGTVGEITVFNDAGVQILNTPLQATRVAALNLPPSGSFTMSVEQFNSSFGSAVAVLPPSPTAGDQGGPGDPDGEVTGDGEPADGDAEGEGEGEAAGDADGDGDGEGEGEDEEQLAEADPEGEGEGEGEGTGDSGPEAASPSPTSTGGEAEGPTEGDDGQGDGGDIGTTGNGDPNPTLVPAPPPAPTPAPVPVQTAPVPTGPTTTIATPSPDTGTETTAANNPPDAEDGTAELDEDTSHAGQLAATDPDGNTVTFALANGPTHGSVSVFAGGAYTYTPDGDYFGSDSFTFTATDTAGSSDTATISLTVNDVSDVPTSGDDTLTGGAADNSFVMDQSGPSIPSGTLGGTDSLDGGAGVDQVTFDNLQMVTGYFDASTSTARLWGWADVGGTADPDAPANAAATTAQATVTFSNMEEVYFGSYDGTTGAQYGIDFTIGDPFVGMLVAGGTGADWINWNGASDEGWFAGADGTVIFGGDGDDVIHGGASDDDIYGGADNDTIYGGDGYNSLSGGAGNDTIYAEGYYDNVINGGDGDDTITITGGTAYHDIDGGTGTDSLVLSAGSDSVILYDVESVTDSGGDDTVTAASLFTSGSSVDLGSGTDALSLATGTNSLTIANVETVLGTMGDDTLNLEGAIASASIDLGTGTDSLVLADGTNTVTVSRAETITGGTGDDSVSLGSVASGISIDLGTGTDSLVLFDGTNSASVSGAETITGGSGTDTLTIDGTEATSVTVDAGLGDDMVTIAAGNSQDILLVSGGGSDNFVLDGSGTHTISYTSSTIDAGAADTIGGFAAGAGGDILDFSTTGMGETFDIVSDPNWLFQVFEPAGVILFTEKMYDGSPTDAADVAAYMPTFSASGVSDVVLVVGNGSSSVAYWWEDTSGNGHVTADELTAIATLTGVDPGTLDASNFSLPVSAVA